MTGRSGNPDCLLRRWGIHVEHRIPFIDAKLTGGVVVADEPQIRPTEEVCGASQGHEGLNNFWTKRESSRGRAALGVLHQNMFTSIYDEVSGVVVGFPYLLDDAVAYRSP